MRARLLWFGFSAFFCLHATLSLAQAKRRVAISIADPVQASSYGYGNPNDPAAKADLEEKIVDAMVSRLSSSSSLVLLDRQKTREVLQEQNNKFDERFDPSSGVKLGKLLGADVLIFVRVQSFAAKASKHSSNKIAFTEFETDGDVNLTATARVLVVETESVLTAPTSTATKHDVLEKTRQLGANVPASVYYPPGQNEPGLLKLRDAAIADVAQDLATRVLTSLSGIPQRSVIPKVAGLDGGKVLINRGASAGIKIGDVFQITRMADTGLKDPDTGQPIIRKKSVCTLTISSIEDSVALGDCSGDIPIAGDLAVSGSSK